MNKRGPLRFTILNATGLDISACGGCDSCEEGCPHASEWDVHPSQVLYWARKNDDRALTCRTIWVCTQCHACEVVCPNGVAFETVAAALRSEARLRRLN
jgi:heterodisulfide reductase subunit C